MRIEDCKYSWDFLRYVQDDSITNEERQICLDNLENSWDFIEFARVVKNATKKQMEYCFNKMENGAQCLQFVVEVKNPTDEQIQESIEKIETPLEHIRIASILSGRLNRKQIQKCIDAQKTDWDLMFLYRAIGLMMTDDQHEQIMKRIKEF